MRRRNVITPSTFEKIADAMKRRYPNQDCTGHKLEYAFKQLRVRWRKGRGGYPRRLGDQEQFGSDQDATSDGESEQSDAEDEYDSFDEDRPLLPPAERGFQKVVRRFDFADRYDKWSVMDVSGVSTDPNETCGVSLVFDKIPGKKERREYIESMLKKYCGDFS
ncbi:hypothetical protein PFICI_02053 [Pestalotiopsis fici W106-1]|uniref:Uncharacterized protein n=1 Tax=Pestalotiopsis fici (strain W106-1 / CGMCC3.15140) TaxID=1229662 RepID=W3XQJ7_PESFW|nr:uncharacterized protein PFICI_02053 [Pestalotiopsis fici W106-1]ETS88225.1 hypothetical protein PFICI_02053 [Pestalotiopsis fici W106-1]